MPTTIKERKTSQKVAKSDADDVSVSAAVRRTRSIQVIQEVILTQYLYWAVM